VPVHSYRVPDPATLVITGAAQPAGVTAADPTTTGEIVSTTVRFVIVAPPMFATVIAYVIAEPTVVPPVTCFVTVKSITGAVSTKPVDGPDLSTVVVHAPVPITYAVFDTAVSTHTTPTVPVIVNVHACPSPNVTALLDHPNSVPDVTPVTAGVGKPEGSDAVALVITGEIVSVTTRFVIVIVPVFATTTRYVTVAPVPGAAGVCVFTIDNPVTGAGTRIPARFVFHTVVPHGVVAMIKAVFDTPVFTHTTPIRPVIENVVLVPG